MEAKPKMIACPICGGRTSVVETRTTGASTRRRRICMAAGCSGKVTTVEVVVPEGRPSMLGRGTVIASVRHIAQLRKVAAAIGVGKTGVSARHVEQLRKVVAAIGGAA